MRSKKIFIRLENLKKVLLQQPWSEAELAEKFERSRKTIKRDLLALKETGHQLRWDKEGLVSMIDRPYTKANKGMELSFHKVTRFFYLLFLIMGRHGVSYNELKRATAPQHALERDDAGVFDVFEDDKKYYGINCEEETLKKYLRFLIRKGYVYQTEERYYPGQNMLPSLPLNRQEIVEAVSLLRESAELSPYRSSLTLVQGKLLATHLEREAVLDNETMLRRMERTLYHGRPFIEDYRIARLREELEHAIKNRCRVEITYSVPGKEQTRQTISPLRCSYNRFNDLWHVYVLPLDRHGFPQVRRLDRISTISITRSRFLIPPALDLKVITDHGWGVRVSPPLKVKVRINGKYNLKEKIRRQIRNRPYAKLYSRGDSLFYEDEISGMEEFLHWLRQFGYAAEVLEPPGLRAAVLRSARRTLERYGEMPAHGADPQPGAGNTGRGGRLQP